MRLSDYKTKKKTIENEINRLKLKKQYLQSKATWCTTSFDPMSGYNASHHLHPMEDAIVEIKMIDDMVNEYEKNLKELNKEFATSIRKIGDPTLEMLLVLKYIEEASWKEIGSVLYYSRTHLHRLLKGANARLDEVNGQ